MKADVEKELDRYVAAHKQQVIAAVENVWDKYRVTLRNIESDRGGAKARLDGLLKELGYA